MIQELNKFLEYWEPIWLFVILFTETGAGFATLYILIKEYKYDEQKDLAKAQRKTKTTKKITTQPGGASITEETSEVSEPATPEGPKGEGQ